MPSLLLLLLPLPLLLSFAVESVDGMCIFFPLNSSFSCTPFSAVHVHNTFRWDMLGMPLYECVSENTDVMERGKSQRLLTPELKCPVRQTYFCVESFIS